MQSGIVSICRDHFGRGVTTVDQMFSELRAGNVEFKEPSVRAIVSEMRKKAGLISSRGRPKRITSEIERVFDSGQGITTVAGVLLHLKDIKMECSPKTVRTVIQSLRKQHKIIGEKQNVGSENDAGTTCTL